MVQIRRLLLSLSHLTKLPFLPNEKSLDQKKVVAVVVVVVVVVVVEFEEVELLSRWIVLSKKLVEKLLIVRLKSVPIF